MSAARFREAAKVLRERADMATEGHIWHAALGERADRVCGAINVDDLMAERDALAARLAAVEALADEWEREAREQSIVGGESPRPADYSEGYYVGTMRARVAHAAHLRAALDGSQS